MANNDDDGSMTLDLDRARALGREGLVAAGASEESARILADAAVEAEAQGYGGVGLAHLLDYRDGLEKGRIDGTAEPVVERPTPIVFKVDAREGIPHLGFERVYDDMVDAAREYGLSVFLGRNGFTCAALGYFVERFARQGLLALAATNGGPALLAGSGTREAVFCTNPMAFASPRANAPPVVIDQSCSATAYVNIQRAARDGAAIPQGWALDARGDPTTDPSAALEGTLLPFAGQRGANLALMVEILAAGLCGANWSLDAPAFYQGDRCPGTGLFVLAVDPTHAGEHVATRIGDHLSRLGREFGAYIPGDGRAAAFERAAREGIRVPAAIYDALAG